MTAPVAPPARRRPQDRGIHFLAGEREGRRYALYLVSGEQALRPRLAASLSRLLDTFARGGR